MSRGGGAGRSATDMDSREAREDHGADHCWGKREWTSSVGLGWTVRRDETSECSGDAGGWLGAMHSPNRLIDELEAWLRRTELAEGSGSGSGRPGGGEGAGLQRA